MTYDYGMGGARFYVWANSAEEIVREFPEFTVELGEPSWLTEDWKERLERGPIYDLALDANREPLAAIKRDRPERTNS